MTHSLGGNFCSSKEFGLEVLVWGAGYIDRVYVETIMEPPLKRNGKCIYNLSATIIYARGIQLSRLASQNLSL